MRSFRRWWVPAALLVLGATGCTPKAAPPKNAAPPLKPGAFGHIVIAPYVQPGRDGRLSSSLRVVWWSDAPGQAGLEVRQGGGGGGVLNADTVLIEGLYRHSAEVAGTGGSQAFDAVATVTVGGKRFTSPLLKIPFPAAGPRRPFRFAAFGDTGAGTPAERRVVQQALRQKPEVLLIPGDVVYDTGSFPEYRTRLFPYFQDLMSTVPVLPVMGNHDTGDPATMGAPFCQVWLPPEGFRVLKDHKPAYSVLRRRANRGEGPVPDAQQRARNYSADAGDCHFVGLDSTADHDTMRDFIVPWLRDDLARARRNGARWIIAFWHHPPYTHGSYRDNSLQWGDVRQLFLPVLHQYGVQIVVNGHDHNYQHMRKDGTDYIVCGGGGARLYRVVKDYTGSGQPPLLAYNDKVHSFTLFEESVDGKMMSVRQIDENGHQLDAFSIKLEEPGP